MWHIETTYVCVINAFFCKMCDSNIRFVYIVCIVVVALSRPLVFPFFGVACKYTFLQIRIEYIPFRLQTVVYLSCLKVLQLFYHIELFFYNLSMHTSS